MKVRDLFGFNDELRDFADKLKRVFPHIYRFSLDIPVRRMGREDYAHLEVHGEFLEILEEVGDWETAEAIYGEKVHYVRRIGGMADMLEGVILVRDMPPPASILFHEILHLYYYALDQIISGEHGMAEVLAWMLLEGQVETGNPQRTLDRYVNLMKIATDGRVERRKHLTCLIERAVSRALNIPPVIQMFYFVAGSLAYFDSETIFLLYEFMDTKDAKILTKLRELTDYEREPYEFLRNAVIGLNYSDPFWSRYASLLFLK